MVANGGWPNFTQEYFNKENPERKPKSKIRPRAFSETEGRVLRAFRWSETALLCPKTHGDETRRFAAALAVAKAPARDELMRAKSANTKTNQGVLAGCAV